MKKALLFIISLTLSYMSFSQTRYIDEIFNDVTVHSDVNYGTNVSVLPLLLGAPPSPTPLLCDIYEPSGDSLTWINICYHVKFFCSISSLMLTKCHSQC